MNLLKGSIVFLALLQAALAADATLTKADFAQAKVAPGGLIEAELSPAGFAKVKNLHADQDVEIRVAGETQHLHLRDPIRGARLEFGPVSEDAAHKIVREINK